MWEIQFGKDKFQSIAKQSDTTHIAQLNRRCHLSFVAYVFYSYTYIDCADEWIENDAKEDTKMREKPEVI